MFPAIPKKFLSVREEVLLDQADYRNCASFYLVGINSVSCNFTSLVPLDLLGYTSSIVGSEELKNASAVGLASSNCGKECLCCVVSLCTVGLWCFTRELGCVSSSKFSV